MSGLVERCPMRHGVASAAGAVSRQHYTGCVDSRKQDEYLRTLLTEGQHNSKPVTQWVTRSLVLPGDNEGCQSWCCGDDANRGTQWRRYPVINEGQAASRRHWPIGHTCPVWSCLEWKLTLGYLCLYNEYVSCWFDSDVSLNPLGLLWINLLLQYMVLPGAMALWTKSLSLKICSEMYISNGSISLCEDIWRRWHLVACHACLDTTLRCVVNVYTPNCRYTCSSYAMSLQGT